jgi:hypothetical protein
LQAAVNPEGWDTTVYFQWKTLTLTNTTPGIDIGAGAASVNVSSFVPALAPSTSYQYRVVASNALGTTFGNVAWDPNQHHYFFSGSRTNITLNPGTYIITAYGAPGGRDPVASEYGGLGAEMSAEFDFSTATNLTLLVGGGGGGSFVVEDNTPLVIAGGGGGGGDQGGPDNASTEGNGNGGFYRNGYYGGGTDGGGGGGGGTGAVTPHQEEAVAGAASWATAPMASAPSSPAAVDLVLKAAAAAVAVATIITASTAATAASEEEAAAGTGGCGGGGGYSGGGGGFNLGGGGGSIIDSSAITILTEVSGIASPDDPPGPFASYYSGNGEIIITAVPTPLFIPTHAAFGFTNGVFGFNLIGPSGSNVVILVSTDMQTWIPLQTNLLGSGPLYFSDPQSTTNVQRFYRVQLSP